QKALGSCIEKLSTFRNKAMAKQKFYFLRFAQKSMYSNGVLNSYKYFIFVYLPDLRYTINHADKILLTKEKSTYE
ncbi:hypothetical protein, partial [Bariatricus sp. HCP28S3_C2]|uniref:hypothetical protein n=1 Tax=unclassified Bariatricus TaxID=2677046 RepID=UPI003F89EBD0